MTEFETIRLTGGPIDTGEFTSTEMTAIANEHLGHEGMCLGSKSGYRRRYPRNLVLFNANVIASGEKVWWGDMDLSDPETVQGVVALAKRLRRRIAILNEFDCRFETAESPLLENALLVVAPDGTPDWVLGGWFREGYHLWHGVPKMKKQ